MADTARASARRRLDLWRKLREINEEGSDEEWEPEGRRREYLDADRALMPTLGLSIGDFSPASVRHEEVPDTIIHNPLAVEKWRKARVALIGADRACC